MRKKNSDTVRHECPASDQILQEKNVLSNNLPVVDSGHRKKVVSPLLVLDYNVENSKIMAVETKFAIAMKAANLSPKKLAEITGISQKTIEGFAYGARDFNRCRVSMAVQIANALNCDIIELLDKEGE